MDIFLFDVDDVVNVIGSPDKKHVRRSGWNPDAWREAQYGPYKVQYNAEMVAAINQLRWQESNLVGWLTTWTHVADNTKCVPGWFETSELNDELHRNKKFLNGLGFEDFLTLDHPGRFSPGHGAIRNQWWKYRAIEYVMESRYAEKITVFDDALTKESGKADLKKIAENHGIEFQGVTVSTGLGLTKRQFEEFTR